MNKQSNKTGESTVELLGIKEITQDSLLTTREDELAFYLVKPSNLAVLSAESTAARVHALMHVLGGEGDNDLEMLCLNSRADFEDNKNYYRSRIAKEVNPEIHRLLEKDRQYLDYIQVSMATAREFLLIMRLSRQGGQSDREHHLRHVEHLIQEQGFSVTLAGKEDIKRILAVYFQQNVVAGRLDDFDGQRWVIQ